MRNKVLILGYGEMGHALQTLLVDRHELFIWDTFPAAGVDSVALEVVAPQVDFVLFCLPVKPHREIATEIAPLLKDSCICLSIAKGLDASGKTAAQIFAEVFGRANRAYGVLYGPMIAEELSAGRYGFAQLACASVQSYLAVQQLFITSRCLLTTSHDITGISWAVILKNVYAMVFGMADELRLGDNTRGFLLVFALHELDAIVRHLGGEATTAYGLAGLGDLVTTATSEDSHHHALGRQLARGERSDIQGEGVNTLQMVAEHDIFPWREYPLFSLVHEIVLAKREPGSAIEAFIQHTRVEKR